MHNANHPSPSLDLLRKHGLDWKVKKYPLEINLGENHLSLPSNNSALMRVEDGDLLNNRMYDIVPDNWNIVQNSAAMEIFDRYAEAGQMKMHSAGSFKNGQIVWVLAELSDSTFEVVKDDVNTGFFLFVNPHAYGKTVSGTFTAIRITCWNSLQLAIGSENTEYQVRLNHSREFDPTAFKNILRTVDLELKDYKELAQHLAKTKISPTQIQEYFGEVFPPPNSKNVSRNHTLANYSLETQPGASFGQGTFWQAFNACTYVVDHLAGKGENTRQHNAWLGTGRWTKTEALAIAEKMAA